MIYVIKKRGWIQNYDPQKIIDAVNKSAQRAMVKLSSEDFNAICDEVEDEIISIDYTDYKHPNDEYVPVEDMHCIVENVLHKLFPKVGNAYASYRNYKQDFVATLDKSFEESKDILYLGDKENSNSDSSFVSTQQALIRGVFTKALYKHIFLTKEELQAINDGYIYIHDMKDRPFCINCCLFDCGNVLHGGFEMGNLWYNEPKTADSALDVIGDLIMATASQQYGGFTVPRIDSILAPYAQKSYDKYYAKYKSLGVADEKCREQAIKDVENDIRQGYQGLEYKLNSVASSRGDYPFTSFSFGLDTSFFGKMISRVILDVRKNGQGKAGHKKPVLFPKLTFLYDKNLHGKGKELYDLFLDGIDCSSKTMYPDWLSLTGEGYIPSMYKKYGKVVSLMG